jgi:hypothetical protein
MGIRFGTPQNRENELKTVSGIQKIAEMGAMSILILDDSKIKKEGSLRIRSPEEI